MDHTIEPQFAFESIDTINEPDEIPARWTWANDSVYQWINPRCSYCGEPIESNDPDDIWFHVGQ